MTRKEAKNMAAIMQAYADGKTIQFLGVGGEWVDMKKPSFRSRSIYYRIKPELKYRPFKTKEGCWNEMLKHQPFGWVINENEDYLCLLSINKHFEEKDFSYMFRTYRFADGTPFGIGE